EEAGVEGQPVQVPRSPRSADFAGPLVGRQPRMSSRVGKVRLGPRVVQPQGLLGRGQLVSLEETLEQQVTPLPQVRHATVGHPHPGTLSALAVRPQRHSTVQLLRVTAELADWADTLPHELLTLPPSPTRLSNPTGYPDPNEIVWPEALRII